MKQKMTKEGKQNQRANVLRFKGHSKYPSQDIFETKTSFKEQKNFQRIENKNDSHLKLIGYQNAMNSQQPC